jgi:hypothetical protein
VGPSVGDEAEDWFGKRVGKDDTNAVGAGEAWGPGSTEGTIKGNVEGFWEPNDGAALERATDGVADGLDDGDKDSIMVTEGELEGISVELEALVGMGVNAAVGLSDGLLEGPVVGAKDGVVLGRRSEGIVDGLSEGSVVGATGGAVLGRRDGGILIPSTIIIDSMVSTKASNWSFS